MLPRAGSHGLFPTYRSRRLINFSSHTDPENMILLCKECHKRFDSNSQPPSWILVPCELWYFLSYEKRRGWNDGSFPSAEGDQSSLNQYRFYTAVDTKGHPTLRAGAKRNGGVVIWRGNPIAMILKAAAGVNRIPAAGAEIPREVRDMLHELHSLYIARPTIWTHNQATRNVICSPTRRQWVTRFVCSPIFLARYLLLDTFTNADHLLVLFK